MRSLFISIFDANEAKSVKIKILYILAVTEIGMGNGESLVGIRKGCNREQER